MNLHMNEGFNEQYCVCRRSQRKVSVPAAHQDHHHPLHNCNYYQRDIRTEEEEELERIATRAQKVLR